MTPETTDDMTPRFKTITTIGRDPESGIWFFQDCAFLPDADFYSPGTPNVIFRRDSGYFLHAGTIYFTDFALADQGAPRFFSGECGGDAGYRNMQQDPLKEAHAVGRIFYQLAADMVANFGGPDGLLALGTTLSHLIAPELIRNFNAHPGLWLHGRCGVGKSETLRVLMQMWGFDSNYIPLSLSARVTNVALQRLLAEYQDVPIHIDEFRLDQADKDQLSSLRHPYTRHHDWKACLNSHQPHSIQARTSPMITGNGESDDAATMSRYLVIELSKSDRLGDPTEQWARFERMRAQAKNYHRIIRYLLMIRNSFATAVIPRIEQFVDGLRNEPRPNDVSGRNSYNHSISAAMISQAILHFKPLPIVNPTTLTNDHHGLSQRDFDLVENAISNLENHCRTRLAQPPED